MTSEENVRGNTQNDKIIINPIYMKPDFQIIKNMSENCNVNAPLNINSLRNKFDSLKNTICRNIDILLISQTKPDDFLISFAQFKIDGLSAPFTFDSNNKGGELLIYIREDTPSRQLFRKSQYYTETISVEISLKW